MNASLVGSAAPVVNRYRPYAVLPPHGHAGASLSLVLDGDYLERIGRRSWQCASLSILYKPPEMDHSNHIGGRGLQGLFLEIAPDAGRSLSAEYASLTDVRCTHSVGTERLVRRVRRLVAHGVSRVAIGEDVVYDCLLEVVGDESRLPGRDRGAWLTHVRDFLHANYRRELTLTDAAAVGGIHPVHLAQTFRRTFGCTFRAYLRALRLDAARADLADTTRTIAQIALAAGFADHAHFSRTFVARFGQTPTHYRRTLA